MNPQAIDAAIFNDPVEPEEAHNADNAEAGGIASARGSSVDPQSEDTDSTTVPGQGTGDDDDENDVHQVWIRLKDDDGNVVPNERFLIRFSDGSERPGRTNDEGVGGFERIPEGDCEVNFTQIHESEWS